MTEENNFGAENSAKICKDWGNYAVTNQKDSMVALTNGTNIDWETDKGPGGPGTSSGTERQGQASGDGSNRRWIFALRHGERVDFTFGKWIPYCFDEDEQYTRKDLNMPVTLPVRAGGKEAFQKDTPLTRFGEMQAELVGEGLRLAGIKIHHIYSSPALRCVQTAQACLKGLQADSSVKIKVEPSLFEYKQWYAAKGLGPFMTIEEYHGAGYNVDLGYKPYMEHDNSTSESLQEFYERTKHMMHSAVKDTEASGGNIIFSAHGCAPDMMVHAMKELANPLKEYPDYRLLPDILRKVPYCALAAVKTNPWEVVPPPCPPSMNSSSGRFDWKMLSQLWEEL